MGKFFIAKFYCYFNFAIDYSSSMITSQVRRSEVRLVRPSIGFLWGIGAVSALSLVLIVMALWFWGAKEVRHDWGEVSFLAFIGIVWLVFAHRIYPWLGLGIRDDALERKNPAALVALCSALLSTALTFAAGNLGEGPSYWENIFCSGLATGGLFLLWFVLELGSHVSTSIAEDRDFASGLRLGGLLLSWGLILGRAVTGNWHSCTAAAHDFLRDGWPAAIICLVAFVVELFLRPSRLQPFPSWPICGLIPALLYLAAAIAWLRHLGAWEGMPI